IFSYDQGWSLPLSHKPLKYFLSEVFTALLNNRLPMIHNITECKCKTAGRIINSQIAEPEKYLFRQVKSRFIMIVFNQHSHFLIQKIVQGIEHVIGGKIIDKPPTRIHFEDISDLILIKFDIFSR